jgi:hypothetical protein
MNEAQFELLLAITLSVPLRPPAPSAARFAQIMVPNGADRAALSSASRVAKRVACQRKYSSPSLGSRRDSAASDAPTRRPFAIHTDILLERRSRSNVGRGKEIPTCLVVVLLVIGLPLGGHALPPAGGGTHPSTPLRACPQPSG